MAFTDDDIAADQLQSNSSPGHRVRHNNLNAVVRELLSLTYDARQYGAFPDSSSDELSHLQDAIDACADAGGGTVRLLPGEYLITDQLVVNPPVILEGAGRNTILKRSGSDVSPLVYLQSPENGATKLHDGGVRRMTLDGNGATNYGIRMTSVNACIVERCMVQGATLYQVQMDCWDDHFDDSTAPDNQQNHLSDLLLIASGSAGGLRVTGSPTLDATQRGNTSLNEFENIWVQGLITGDAFFFGNSDGNESYNLRADTSSTGRGLVLGAGAFANKGHARENVFHGIQMGDADVYALAGVTDSGPNLILGMSRGNGGTANPHISSGATLKWLATDGTGNL